MSGMHTVHSGRRTFWFDAADITFTATCWTENPLEKDDSLKRPYTIFYDATNHKSSRIHVSQLSMCMLNFYTEYIYICIINMNDII